MEYGAIDLHVRYSQICIINEMGETVREQRVVTSRAAVMAALSGRARMRVLIESGTDSEWVAQAVEASGHEVIVVDPNYALMYGHRPRGIKTDRRDAAALAAACRAGVYRRAHRVSASQRETRRALRIREQLVRIRTQLINQIRAQLRQEGQRLPSGSAERAIPRLARLSLPAPLREALAPIIAVLETVETQVTRCTGALTRRAADDPVVCRLRTMPGVGPITALTYRAVLDEVTRFGDARAVSAYLGLVPREASTGERQRRGAITKAGPTALRVLLIQVGWVMWRGRRVSAALHAWVHRLADRRGRRVAIVALARRIARILYAMWRDQTDYRIVRAAA